MAARTSAVISIIWFLLPLRCNPGSGQAVSPSFCRRSPSAGLWRRGFYILFRWIPCTRTAAQCTVPKEREVPSGVLPVLRKIEIHSGISHKRVLYLPLYSLFSILLSLISNLLSLISGRQMSPRLYGGQMSACPDGSSFWRFRRIRSSFFRSPSVEDWPIKSWMSAM